ncbi:HNH endonuclease [Pseudoxanthomonas winnipegensis]|nr:HNH endonuclease [Pseudoxanthomonas winnipegensis]
MLKSEAFRTFGAEIKPAISTSSWITESPRELVVSLWKHNFSEDFSAYSDEITHWSSSGGVKFKRDVADALKQGLPVRVVLAQTDQVDLVRNGRAKDAKSTYDPRPDLIGTIIRISNDEVVFAFETVEASSTSPSDARPSGTSPAAATAKYWRVVEAVEALGTGTLAEIVAWLDQRYPGDPIGNPRADLELLTVNSPSRRHLNVARHDWRSNLGHHHDRIFKLTDAGPPPRTRYTLFNPAVHGHVSLEQSSDGKWLVVALSLGELAQAEVEGKSLASLPPINSDHDSRVWAMRAISQRQGQPQFRMDLLDAYEGCCAVTGSNAVRVLEAAHIHPYRGEHTNRVDNGLLLRSDIHTLFDLGLLWFEDLRLAVSAELKGTDYEAMHGTPLRLPRMPACHPNPEHLKHHAHLARQRNGLDEARK